MNTRADAVGVTMENVVKKYGQTTALRDFGLVVEPGEMVVLLCLLYTSDAADE